MQIFVLFALFAASQAAVLLGGASETHRSEDGLGNYAFGYNEGHGSGATFRKETGSHGVVSGSYGLSVADGRQRIVNYVADAAGFRASVNTNEPGVEPKDPAHTAINKAAAYIAPAVVAPHYAAAPLHHAAAVHHAAPISYAHPAAAGLHYGHAGAPLHYAHAGAPLHYAHAGAPLHYNSVVSHGLGHHGGYYW